MADYLSIHSEIKEVILSGGDPLLLTNKQLDTFISSARKFSNIVSIRIHTRMLGADPDRITYDLYTLFEEYYPLTIVTHFNHPAELGKDVEYAIRKLRKAGVSILNQTVLLRDINDNVSVMKDLLLELLRIGIKPYYLHQCDEVMGVSHFRTKISRGTEIIRELRGNIPGIAIPNYVLDLSGGGGKIPLEGSYRTNETDRESYYGLTGEIYSITDGF
jgi:lysine 2,3-aminomutase